MGKTTRRDFIKKSGFSMLTVGVSGKAFFRHLNMAANSALTAAAALSPNDNVLVVIQLAGGNDGLNTVIPVSGQLRTLYESYRQTTLEIPVANILPIGRDDANNELGFHPSFQKLKTLYDQGRVGVIQAVGYPNPNYSHFSSMDIWHRADPTQSQSTGWLGDYLDVCFPSTDNPLIAMSIGGGILPLSLRAENTPVPAIGSIPAYIFQTDSRNTGDRQNQINAFLALNQEGASADALYEQVRQTALDAYESSVTLQNGANRYVPDPNIVYPTNNPLAGVLRQAAQVIAGDLGTKIIYVSMGGFDTHQTQAQANSPLTGFHATLLGYLSDAVDAFYRDLVRMGKAENTLIMTWSEFGRKVKENGNFGTDHAAAAPQFVFGNAIQKRITGNHPSLTDLYQGQDAMKHSIDFRSYYATILEKWLAVDSRDILGGTFAPLNFI